jgi:hypothetical protein
LWSANLLAAKQRRAIEDFGGRGGRPGTPGAALVALFARESRLRSRRGCRGAWWGRFLCCCVLWWKNGVVVVYMRARFGGCCFSGLRRGWGDGRRRQGVGLFF